MDSCPGQPPANPPSRCLLETTQVSPVFSRALLE
jgi:hypothetical protein